MVRSFAARGVSVVGFLLCPLMCVLGDPFIQVSVTPDAQLVSEEESVCGLRLCLPYGRNASVTGLDGGFVTETVDEASALQFAAIGNVVEQNGTGLQIGLFNSVGNEMDGGQVGGFFNSANKFNGIGIAGGVNRYVEGKGILLAGCCNRGEVLKGAQISLFNVSTYSSGLQIGLVNWTKNAQGFQIGLINYIDEGALPFMPFLNVNFE